MHFFLKEVPHNRLNLQKKDISANAESLSMDKQCYISTNYSLK